MVINLPISNPSFHVMFEVVEKKRCFFNTDEIEFGDQMTISPTHAYGVQSGNQFQVSVAETSHQMEDFSSMLTNGFAIADSCTAGLHGWGTTASLGPQGMTHTNSIPNFNENFQVDTPAWQGSSFLLSQTNQALGVVSSIRFPGTGKSKAGWCKIRAVIKWRMVKNICQKNAKSSSKYFF